MFKAFKPCSQIKQTIHLTMKTIIATFAFALTSLVVTAQKRLVAEVYPNAVTINTSEESLILTRNSGYSTANVEAYLVKDEKNKVMAFYHKKHKKAKNIRPCENGDQYLEIQTQQQTGEYGSLSAGVVISSNPYKKTTQEGIGGFDELRDLVKLNFHTEDEFDKVYARYKHLNHAFFNSTSEKDTIDGGLLNLQEQLYKKYAEKAKPADIAFQMEALVVKIEELTEAGKYEESHILTGKLRDLMDKPTSPVQQSDTWTVWMEYFNILEQNAYKTMIIIHKPIARWHMDEAVVLQEE